MQPKIFTQRLVLSKVKEMDIPFLAYCLNEDEAHGRFLSSNKLLETEVAHRVRTGAYWNEDSKTYIIKLRDDATRIGIIHYWLKSDDRQIATYSVQIALPEKRNLGYGSEAQLALIRMLFVTSRITAVEIYTDTQNLVEAHVLEKLGFQIQQTRTYIDVDVERTGHVFFLPRETFESVANFLQ